MMKVSVLMSVYREKEKHLRLAIESILKQTYGDFEFIMVLDDPKNKKLKMVMQEYQGRDERIRLIFNEVNIGLAMSLNEGIDVAKGEYLARMDADDIAAESRFDRQLTFMKNHPEIDILGTNKILIDDQGETIGKGNPLPTSHDKINQVMRYSNIMVHPSIMMKSESINQLGGYRDFPTTQDADLWLRALAGKYKMGNLDEYLMYYRINGQSVSFQRAYKQAIIGQYIRQLYSERLKNGTDSFSQQSLEQFLQKNCVEDVIEAEKFQKARKKFEMARLELKNKQIVRGIGDMADAYFGHPLMRRQINRVFVSAVLKIRA